MECLRLLFQNCLSEGEFNVHGTLNTWYVYWFLDLFGSWGHALIWGGTFNKFLMKKLEFLIKTEEMIIQLKYFRKKTFEILTSCLITFRGYIFIRGYMYKFWKSRGTFIQGVRLFWSLKFPIESRQLFFSPLNTHNLLYDNDWLSGNWIDLLLTNDILNFYADCEA